MGEMTAGYELLESTKEGERPQSNNAFIELVVLLIIIKIVAYLI